MQEIYLEKSFNAPAEKVFEILGDHERMGEVFGAPIKRLRPGQDGHLNGKGSIREIKLGPGLAFEETVTDFKPNALMEYMITKGSPLKNHKGKLELIEQNGKTQLRYRIIFESKYPLPFFGSIVRWTLEQALDRGLNKVAKKFA